MTATFPNDRDKLRAEIERVLASKSRDLDDARRVCDAIYDADLTDDAALTAYDLLQDRIIHGRAW